MSEEEVWKYLATNGYITDKPDHTDSSKSTTILPSRHTSANDSSTTKLEEADMPADFIQKIKMMQYAKSCGVDVKLNELVTWEKQHTQESEALSQTKTLTSVDLLHIIKPNKPLLTEPYPSMSTSTPSTSDTTSTPAK